MTMLAALAIGSIARSQTAPTTQPADYELREWVVLVCSANQPMANSASAFKSTMPSIVTSRRANAPPDALNAPMPIGVIRVFSNSPDISPKLDVLLQLKAGQFNAHWPAGQVKSNRLLWQDMKLSATAPAGIGKVDADHWLAKLRAGESTYLVGNKEKDEGADRVLVYDAEVAYPLPLKVQVDGDPAQRKYQISNTGERPLLHLELCRPLEGVCATASIAQLAAAKPPATKPASLPTTRSDEIFASATSASAPASKPKSSSAPATEPAGQSIALQPASNMAAAQSIQNIWKSHLSESGLLATDIDLICSILSRYGADEKHLTAIYQLDPAELDRLLPLELVPPPRKTVRVGLVIARDIDPAIAQEIADLVKKLGDDDWSAREAAGKQIAQLGAAAKTQLEAAVKSDDPEVSTRAERLLAAINKAAGVPTP